MILLIDMDGTIVNIVSPIIERVKDIWGLTLREEEVTDVKLEPIIKNKMALVRPGLELDYTDLDIWSTISKSNGENFFENLEPYDNAVEIVKTLSHMGHKIVFLTKLSYPYPDVVYGKSMWLKRYMSDIDYTTIYVEDAAGKYFVDGDILIDDDPRYLTKIRNRECICIAQPWNLNYRKTRPLLKVAYDIKELPEMINKIDLDRKMQYIETRRRQAR